MNGKLFSSAQTDLVFDWCERWLELIDLINEVTGTPEPPTDMDELRYQRLRFWLIGHQEQFLPLWKDFRESRETTSNHSSDDTDVAYLQDVEKYLENPFSYFYEPENLFELATHLDLQSSTHLWEPRESRASMVRPILLRTGEIMVDFVDWVSE